MQDPSPPMQEPPCVLEPPVSMHFLKHFSKLFNEVSSCWLLFCCPEPASGMRYLGMTVELSGIPWQHPLSQEKGGFH